MKSYDSWKADDSEREVRSRCECCHKLRYGCVDADFGGETWHVCPICIQSDDPRDAYVDPDDLRESRQDRG